MNTKSHQRVASLFIGLSILMLSFVANAATPEAVIKSATSQMISELNKNRARVKSDKQYIYTLVNKVLVPHVDFAEMSKRVLAVSWREASGAQRSAFTSAFKTLVIKTYAEAFRNYDDQTVEITDQRRSRSNPSLVEIRSLIKQSDGPDIPVNYRLKKKGSGWKVYDMTVEGVSLVGNFRSQFKGKIRESGIDALIADIKQRNKKLK